MNTKHFYLDNSYIRVATACPKVHVASVPDNIKEISNIYLDATENNINIILFPEMSITGYTIGDLVHQSSLHSQVMDGLVFLSSLTSSKNTVMIVGCPFIFENTLYNCAAVLSNGYIRGVVPKSNLPTYNEFYEDRWYEPWNYDNTTYLFNRKNIPFGNNILFDVNGTKFGIEICEDLWVSDSPSSNLVKMGAQLIFNPSASPEQVGKSDYRRTLISIQSGKLICGYIYAGCDVSESTAEIVMSGHQIIAVNGVVVKERSIFDDSKIMFYDIDIDHLNFDRMKHHTFFKSGALIVETKVKNFKRNSILTTLDKNPFLPEEITLKRRERLDSIIWIQSHALAMRLNSVRNRKVVLGLSGGLDSTLALFVARESAKVLHMDPSELIEVLIMPSAVSSSNTQSNAKRLADELNIPSQIIPINELVKIYIRELKFDQDKQDITYENIQARIRTTLLFNYANKVDAIVLGTGDLSEIALGWCTYNGDQQSHYNVNSSVPKTVIKELVLHISKMSHYKKVRLTLMEILNTPISPELTSNGDNSVSQSTESIIGPYALHDFFIYYLVRWGDSPEKIIFLASLAFNGIYTKKEIIHWFREFIRRFTYSQFKRENLPNGPKVSSVSLSPRGDWRMPSDLYNSLLWVN